MKLIFCFLFFSLDSQDNLVSPSNNLTQGGARMSVQAAVAMLGLSSALPSGY